MKPCSISFDHWHLKAINTFEVTFWRRQDGGELSYHIIKNPTNASMQRLMKIVWEQVTHGDWAMYPSSTGSNKHWTYTVEEVEDEDSTLST